MILFFTSSNFNKTSHMTKKVIGHPDTYEECMKIINVFIKDHNYISHYTRIWKEQGNYFFDVGSYTEFFELDPGGKEIKELSEITNYDLRN